MVTPTQEDFENFNFDHFNGLYTHISPQICKIWSVSDRNNARSHVFTYVVYLITEYVHGSPYSTLLPLLSVFHCKRTVGD